MANLSSSGAVIDLHVDSRHFRTAERCWEISQGYAFFAYPLEYFDNSGIRTLKGCRGLLAPLPGCDSWGVSIPGVRKKRVPLANLLAPLRGARYSKAQTRACSISSDH